MEKELLRQLIESFAPDQIEHAKGQLLRWRELDTWPANQALMLMVGIDPHRADYLVWSESGMTSEPNPVWAHLAVEPSVVIDSKGVPQVAGYILNLHQLMILARLVTLWGSGESRNLLSRHPPDFFEDWAESKGYKTFLSLVTRGAAQAAPVAVSNSAPPTQNKRRDLLTPRIEAAQRGAIDLYDAPEIWAKLCTMANEKIKPLLGITSEGIQWIDSNDEPQFLSLSNLRDRLGRQKRATQKSIKTPLVRVK